MARSYDISFLQETKITKIKLQLLEQNGDVFISSTGVARRGAITLCHQRTTPTHLYVHSDPEGQFIVNVVIIKNEFYVVINVYGNPDTDAAALATMTAIHDQLQHVHQNF